MATLVENEAHQAVSELDVLIPDRVVVISGRSLTIRAYTLVDSLTIRPMARGLIDDFALVMESASSPTFEQVQGLLAAHAAVVPFLVSVSVEQPVEWVATLPATEGIILMDWWWAVNGSFFIQSALREITVKKHIQSAMPKSSPPSSGQATTPSD